LWAAFRQQSLTNEHLPAPPESPIEIQRELAMTKRHLAKERPIKISSIPTPKE
jgi:hypothetical protein